MWYIHAVSSCWMDELVGANQCLLFEENAFYLYYYLKKVQALSFVTASRTMLARPFGSTVATFQFIK
ncbi:hypothetical protein SAMN04487969_10254 [Paenibacillus algorifonticola]|uniref:Uncharacterized protein n=1 Tax=Paenibacillus algorifonticola TaxID=684063 RepID=A0A1I1ZSF8_9BACL|nr:hypothetical protein SAMN04487969_10254 [Paenibacillus algorifonticola]